MPCRICDAATIFADHGGNRAGAAFVFEGSGTEWELTRRFLGNAASRMDAIAADDNDAIVGDQTQPSGLTDGGVCVFDGLARFFRSGFEALQP